MSNYSRTEKIFSRRNCHLISILSSLWSIFNFYTPDGIMQWNCWKYYRKIIFHAGVKKWKLDGIIEIVCSLYASRYVEIVSFSQALPFITPRFFVFWRDILRIFQFNCVACRTIVQNETSCTERENKKAGLVFHLLIKSIVAVLKINVLWTFLFQRQRSACFYQAFIKRSFSACTRWQDAFN